MFGHVFNSRKPSVIPKFQNPENEVTVSVSQGAKAQLQWLTLILFCYSLKTFIHTRTISVIKNKHIFRVSELEFVYT